MVFVIVFVSPVLLGVTSGWLRQKGRVALLLGRFGINTIHPIPTAWDYQFSSGLPYWLIVTRPDGSRVYGLFGYRSFAGDDPRERDLYMEAVYTLTPTAEWAPVEDSGGILLRSDQIAAIEFRKVPEIDYEERITKRTNSDP